MPEGEGYRRLLRPQDRREIRRLVEATGFFSAEEVEIALELAQEALKRGDASGYHFLLAEEEGRLLGYACFGPIPGSLHSYDLYWIVVDPQRQKKGLGKRLLKAAEGIIIGQGGRRLYAETSSRAQYEPTRSFYRACGFCQEAFLADFYAPGDGKVIFGKTLVPAT